MNRRAFSTLGCPEADLAEVLRLADRYGFAGVELRAQRDQPVHIGLSSSERTAVATRLSRAGITPLSVASYVKVAAPDVADQKVFDAGVAHLQLAADLDAPYLRVFAGGDRDRVDPAVQDQRAAQRLARLATYATDLGVTLALETHDSHRRARDVVRVLDQPGCESVQIIWDVLHTWLGEETPAQSRALIGDRISYVQVKDVPSRDDLTPILMGAGVLPLDEVSEELRDAAYTGWVSWEYERAWHPNQPSLDQLAGLASRWMRQTFAVTPDSPDD